MPRKRKDELPGWFWPAVAITGSAAVVAGIAAASARRTAPCWNCRRPVEFNATSCPYCGVGIAWVERD